jgi:hypothetical protein
MYLSELVFSGLLVGTMRTRKELHKRLKALQPVNPAHTLVSSRDMVGLNPSHHVALPCCLRDKACPRPMSPTAPRVACVIRLAQGQ